MQNHFSKKSKLIYKLARFSDIPVKQDYVVQFSLLYVHCLENGIHSNEAFNFLQNELYYQAFISTWEENRLTEATYDVSDGF